MSFTNTFAISPSATASFAFPKGVDPRFSASLAERSFTDYDSPYYYVMNNEPKLPVNRSLYTTRINSTHRRPQHGRSLTIATNISNSSSSSSSSDSEMATDVTSPGSPPELSSSRSSTKSSSLRSSSLPGEEEDEDMTHFEDISLSEPKHTTSTSPLDGPNKPKHLLRTSTAPATKLNHSTPHLRDVPNGLRHTVTVKNGMRNLKEQRSPVNINGFAPSSSPSLAVPGKTSRRRNNSPSRPSPASPRSATSPTLSRTQSDIGPVFPVRRSPSQQGRRKSAREIEAEFDDIDSDDEVPEEAIITNIPISPHPQHTRSPSASPDREASPPESVGGIEFGRARSWDTALSGLTNEVRDLTLKLKSHADLSRRNSADAQYIYSSPSSSPPRPGLHHSKSTTWTLPPVQKGSPLIDPLPASKEKERHLTRTRPSWLPPKSKQEERKHLKEYKQMMELFVEAEKRKSAESEKFNSRRTSREKNLDEALRSWRHILGDWDNAMTGTKTRDKWWNGIPSALRGQVWARAIGNDLHLSSASFKAALGRAKATEQHLAQSPNPNQFSHARQASTSETKADTRARHSLAMLEKDIASAFPSLGLFQPGQPRYESLRDLLLAYAAYREDTGHVRGTAGIAALLLLQHMPVPNPANIEGEIKGAPPMSPSSREDRDREVSEAATAGAFIAFANLLNKPLSLNFCINDSVAKDRTVRHVLRAVGVKCPRLVAHFSTLSASSQHGADEDREVAADVLKDVVTPLAQSLLTNILTSDEAARLVDIMVFEGDGVIVRAIVGALGRCEGSLYASRDEVQSVLGWSGAGAKVSKGEQEWVDWIRWAGREDAAPPR